MSEYSQYSSVATSADRGVVSAAVVTDAAQQTVLTRPGRILTTISPNTRCSSIRRAHQHRHESWARKERERAGAGTAVSGAVGRRGRE